MFYNTVRILIFLLHIIII